MSIMARARMVHKPTIRGTVRRPRIRRTLLLPAKQQLTFPTYVCVRPWLFEVRGRFDVECAGWSANEANRLAALIDEAPL